jgi:hypothetical protein
MPTSDVPSDGGLERCKFSSKLISASYFPSATVIVNSDSGVRVNTGYPLAAGSNSKPSHIDCDLEPRAEIPSVTRELSRGSYAALKTVSSSGSQMSRMLSRCRGITRLMAIKASDPQRGQRFAESPMASQSLQR